MNSDSITNSDIRRSEEIRIAISTDTILYTPFFLAYYGGDFDNTPFGKLTVNIIGSQDDVRFNQNEKLKGDGFATFCLILGLADAAICDPSYLIYLNNTDNLNSEFEKFEKLLTIDTKSSLIASKNIYKGSIKLVSGKLEIYDIDKFKKLFDDKKVIGNLISKIAFSAIGSPDFEAISKNESFRFGKITNRNIKRDFIEKSVKGKFIYYKPPSTGFCIGEVYALTYKKKQTSAKSTDSTLKEEFGHEISRLYDAKYESSIAITCDFVTLDYILKNDRKNEKRKIIECENFAEDADKNYMFTGILGNCVTTNNEKLKAFLYGIDKNLNYINKSLTDSDTTGLTKYFKKKFNYTKEKEKELLKLLIADENFVYEIQEKIKDEKNYPDFTFDTIIRYYIDRLHRCKKYKGGLYFSSTNPEHDSLKNIVELRYESYGEPFTNGDSFNKFIEEDLLSDWRKNQKDFLSYEFVLNELKFKEKKRDIFNFLAAPILFLNKKWKKNFLHKLWLYVRKPSYLYLVGSLFLMFEMVSSFFHIAGFHITLTSLVELFKKYIYESIPPWIILITITLDVLIFCYFICVTIITIFQARKLLKIKEIDKYIYRKLTSEEEKEIRKSINKN